MPLNNTPAEAKVRSGPGAPVCDDRFAPFPDLRQRIAECNALVVENRRRGSSARICHLVEDRTNDVGAFRRSGWDCLKDYFIKMILVSVKAIAKVVAPLRFLGEAKLDPCAGDVDQTD